MNLKRVITSELSNLAFDKARLSETSRYRRDRCLEWVQPSRDNEPFSYRN